jgi:hypothetical protein
MSVPGKPGVHWPPPYKVSNSLSRKTTSQPPWQKTPGVVQRTTAAQITAEMTSINTLATTVTGRMNALSATLGIAADLGDQDTLVNKLQNVRAQFAGHVGEVVYYEKKVAKHGAGTAFIGAYTDPTHGVIGADVTSPRKVGAKTPFKAAQIKVISAPSYANVMQAIVAAADQLAGATQSGELPHPDAQRIIRVEIANPVNPFPATVADTPAQPLINHTEKKVVDDLWAGLRSNAMEPSFDKVKVIFAHPRTIKVGTGTKNITTITVSRPNGVRGPKSKSAKTYDLRDMTNISWAVT